MRSPSAFASRTSLSCSTSMLRLLSRGCSLNPAKRIGWNNSPLNFTSAFAMDIASSRRASPSALSWSTARAVSTRSKNRFGKRFLLVFLCWQRYPIVEMAFARTTALEFLRRAYAQNRLAHAYLITGPPGSGKEVLAAEVASLVNGTPAKDIFSGKDGEAQSRKEEEKLVKLLQRASRPTTWGIQFAYRLAQEFQQLLRAVREEVKCEADGALKQEQMRYKDATDGAWLEEREEYYKALTESLYLQRRAALVEILFAWWTEVLRASNDVAQRDIPAARQETATLANRFSTAQILRRIRSLEELRDHLGRNIHEGLAIEVAFLAIFTV